MSGPNFTAFGDVVSSVLDFSSHESGASLLNDNFTVMLGQIVGIKGASDPTSDTAELKQFVLYDVQVIHPSGGTEIIPDCRMLQPAFGGGINNFLEVLSTDPGAKAKDFSKNMQDRRGHFCLIAFIAGKKNSAVILGSMPHTSPSAVKRRPKKEKGTHLEGEVQGFHFTIDNDGALKVTFNGPRKDDGGLVDSTLGPTVVEINRQGSVTVSTNAQQSVAVDRVSKTIKITNGTTNINMDQNAEKIQVVAKTVEVGTGALQPAVVGDDWKKIMEELITEITQIVVPTGVGPSGTPINAGKFASIKAKLKEALSKNHKVEK